MGKALLVQSRRDSARLVFEGNRQARGDPGNRARAGRPGRLRPDDGQGAGRRGRRDAADRAAFLAPDTPPELPAGLVRLIRHNAEVPGLVELYTRFSAEAVRPEHPAHPHFRDRYREIRQLIAEAVGELQREGQLRADIDPERFAVLAVALLDGLQVQWLYDPEVDMAEHLTHLWALLAR